MRGGARDALGRKIDAGLSLDIEDNTRRVDDGLLARQRGQPIRNRV